MGSGSCTHTDVAACTACAGGTKVCGGGICGGHEGGPPSSVKNYDFEDGTLPAAFSKRGSGSYSWQNTSASAHGGSHSIASGELTGTPASTGIGLTATSNDGGTISFWYRLDGGSNTTLMFNIGSSTKLQVTAPQPWTLAEIPLPAGASQDLSWQVSSFFESVPVQLWLDDIVLDGITGGDPTDCPAPGQCVDAVIFDGEACVDCPKAEGSACDDGFVCTDDDTCTGGQCAGTGEPDTDADGDGVPHCQDTCPAVKNVDILPSSADAHWTRSSGNKDQIYKINTFTQSRVPRQCSSYVQDEDLDLLVKVTFPTPGTYSIRADVDPNMNVSTYYEVAIRRDDRCEQAKCGTGTARYGYGPWNSYTKPLVTTTVANEAVYIVLQLDDPNEWDYSWRAIQIFIYDE